MTQYGIADIGSNTIVLVVYEIVDDLPVQVFHKSTPAHLIDYVSSDKVMHEDGIAVALKTIQEYECILDEMKVSYRFADITEPCRIQNVEKLVNTLETTSFHIYPLTGYEEAACDFIGAKHAYPSIHHGLAFDVGGGSTELISFENDEIVDAMSFPLGCVRLSHLPLDTDQCLVSLKKARSEYPSLNTTSKEIVGIGGTIRAVGLVCDELYHTSNILPVHLLKKLFLDLSNEVEASINALHKTVNEARWPVFLPGIHMILEICDLYQTETIYISDSGIREGFLMKRIAELS